MSKPAAASVGEIVIASHNLMHGTRVRALHDHYTTFVARTGLQVFCLQENQGRDGQQFAHDIAARLGDRFFVCCDDSAPELAILYDRTHLDLVEGLLVPLPRLDGLTPFERLYVAGGRTHQKYAQVVRLRHDQRGLTLVNLHLDAAGNTQHRRAQVECVAAGLAERQLCDAFVVCGDTNAFTWRRRRPVLDEVLGSLRALRGVVLPSGPTHYFGRQREPLWTHRIAVALGRIGLDWPLQYDVVCTNLPALAHGVVRTPESDHDLVWARLTLP